MTGKDQPYYVIAGLGFSAVLNHLLLKRTDFGKERIGNWPVLHIGETDPWATYDIDRMGQWPALLHLPGFADFGLEPAREFLQCRTFANANRSALSHLTAQDDSIVLRGKITEVEERGGDALLLRATDDKGRTHEITAEKIDICTGLGPPKRFAQEKIASEVLRREYLDESASSTRRLLVGDTALHREIPLRGRICVLGGPTAAWCVERALAAADVSDVLWVMRTLEDPFPVSGRNDRLVQGIARNGWKVELNQVVRPRLTRLQIACGYELECLDLAESQRVKAKFEQFPKAPSVFFVNSDGKDLGSLDCEGFDQVILAVGNESKIPDFLTKIDARWVPIVRPGGNKFARGAESLNCGFSDGEDQIQARIRLLGPAARVLERLKSENPTARKDYLATLPRQADGSLIPVEALHIAWANGVFGPDAPNRNMNLCDVLDLQRLEISRAPALEFMNERGAEVDPCLFARSDREDWSLTYGYLSV